VQPTRLGNIARRSCLAETVRPQDGLRRLVSAVRDGHDLSAAACTELAQQAGQGCTSQSATAKPRQDPEADFKICQAQLNKPG